MRVCIHRGSHQIGGSCIEVEQDGCRILLDLGLPLDSDGDERQYLPDVSGLTGNDPSFLGILISHPHMDHFGLLAHISPNIPIGMGAASRRILTCAASFLPGNWIAPASGWDYQSGQPFNIGPFRVTPFLVDHSAYDAYSLMIEGGGKRLFYSGDFRAHGRKAVLLERLKLKISGRIDTLLLEGSSIGRLDDFQKFPTEDDIEVQLVQAFSEAKGLALVHTSVQNIDRIVSIMRAAKRTGRKLVMDLYAAAMMEATGNNKIPQSAWTDVALFIPQSQRIQIKKNAWFDLLKRHSSNRIYIEHVQQSPEKMVLLFRPLHRFDLERGRCLNDAVYIYSQWEGYWEKGLYDKVKKWLDCHAISKKSIHTSGHAGPTDLKDFVAATSPRKIVPIHSFMPERYPELFDHVEVHNDGEWWEV